MYETQSAWTIQPTYTYYPTYTSQPIIINEITKIIIVTETFTFTPTTTPTITPTKTNSIIIATGYGIIIAYPNNDSINMSYFDLDTGRNDNKLSNDIEYTIGCGSDCFGYIEPINGAIGLMLIDKQPSFADCQTRIPEFEDYGINFPIGYFFCILTNSGNISTFVAVESIPTPDSSTKLKIFYQTWRYS